MGFFFVALACSSFVVFWYFSSQKWESARHIKFTSEDVRNSGGKREEGRSEGGFGLTLFYLWIVPSKEILIPPFGLLSQVSCSKFGWDIKGPNQMFFRCVFRRWTMLELGARVLRILFTLSFKTKERTNDVRSIHHLDNTLLNRQKTWFRFQSRGIKASYWSFLIKIWRRNFLNFIASICCCCRSVPLPRRPS